MGLDMKNRRTLTNEASTRYNKAGKKDKKQIMDEFTAITGYTRKYAIRILANGDKTAWIKRDGTLVRIKTGNPKKRKKRKGTLRYGPEVIAAVRFIWEAFGYRCGKLLAPLIRLIIDFLATDQTFGPRITPDIRAKLLTISGAAIGRRLAPDRKKLALKGKSHTKPGTLLKNQIPVRACFSWDGRKPGCFEMDTVSHCGASSYGEFCSSLNLTDAASGWVEIRACRNRAHSKVKQHIIEIKNSLSFPLKGADSGCGGEFINHQVWQWCKENGVGFTRGRPCRKNDNCFAEQKNGGVIRKTAGCYRFDTGQETAALAEVCRHLCPWSTSGIPQSKSQVRNGLKTAN